MHMYSDAPQRTSCEGCHSGTAVTDMSTARRSTILTKAPEVSHAYWGTNRTSDVCPSEHCWVQPLPLLLLLLRCCTMPQGPHPLKFGVVNSSRSPCNSSSAIHLQLSHPVSMNCTQQQQATYPSSTAWRCPSPADASNTGGLPCRLGDCINNCSSCWLMVSRTDTSVQRQLSWNRTEQKHPGQDTPVGLS